MNFLTCRAHSSNVLAAVSQTMAVWVTAAGGWISSTESVTAALVVPCTRTGTYRYSIIILHSLLSKHFRWMLVYLLLVLLQVLRIKGTVIKWLLCDFGISDLQQVLSSFCRSVPAAQPHVYPAVLVPLSRQIWAQSWPSHGFVPVRFYT